MIFGRKKHREEAEEVADDESVTTEAEGDDVDQRDDTDTDTDADTEADDTDADDIDADDIDADDTDADENDADESEADPDEEPVDREHDEDEWATLDRGEFRDEGPFDITEVDLEDDEVSRLDLGSLIITPFEGAELRLNVVEGTRRIVSAMLVSGNSALDLTVFAAPRSGGLWADTRTQLIAETEQAGGQVTLVEGPFGTEVRRLMPAKGPDGQDAVQPTRTWMAQGPRWALRGVLYGEAALSEALEEDPVLPFYDAFRDVVVRRGDGPQRSGEVLLMTIPEGMGPPADQPAG